MTKLWEADNAATLDDLIRRVRKAQDEGKTTFGEAGDGKNDPIAILANDTMHVWIMTTVDGGDNYGIFDDIAGKDPELLYPLTPVGNQIECFVDSEYFAHVPIKDLLKKLGSIKRELEK